MKKYWKPILVSVLIILLLIGNVYFYKQANTPTIHLHAGIPLSFDEEGNIQSQYFKLITNKEQTDTLLLALINSLPVTEENYPNGNPDATLTVSVGGVGYPYDVWFTEDSVIWGKKGPDLEFYKVFYNDHTNVIPLLKSLLKEIEEHSIRK